MDTGVVTDIDGSFELEIPIENKQDNLIFAYTGYERISINLAQVNHNEIRVVMEEGDAIQTVIVGGGRGPVARVPLRKRLC